MKRISAAQRRKEAIGPGFKKLYLNDGMTYGAWLAINAARLIAEIGRHKHDLLSYKRDFERRRVMKSARICANQAKAARLEARSRCPLP